MAVNMVNDIVSGHRARMLNLKKYYQTAKIQTKYLKKMQNIFIT